MVTVALAPRDRCSALWPASRIGGDSCQRSTKAISCTCRPALPGISVGKMSELLQQTDRLIRSVPEVAHVFAKAGRADTATDPAPARMIETVIQFRAAREWRPGMHAREALEAASTAPCRDPGLSNVWGAPAVRARIDMAHHRIKSPVG